MQGPSRLPQVRNRGAVQGLDWLERILLLSTLYISNSSVDSFRESEHITNRLEGTVGSSTEAIIWRNFARRGGRVRVRGRWLRGGDLRGFGQGGRRRAWRLSLKPLRRSRPAATAPPSACPLALRGLRACRPFLC